MPIRSAATDMRAAVATVLVLHPPSIRRLSSSAVATASDDTFQRDDDAGCCREAMPMRRFIVVAR